MPIDIALMPRNDTPLAIAGRLGGGGVIIVAARCRKCFPDALVTFSAPIYPTSNDAVVYHRMFGHGFGYVVE